MIGCYARVSTTEQAENGHSIDEQQDRMQKYADAMGWTVFKIYTDAGFTGANTDRPALQRMIRDIKAGKIDRVLVYKLDRLSRSQKDTLMLIDDVFLANGCDFVSMGENFDTSTPLGRAMIGILAVFAQLEREQIKERMLMGKEARAKTGKFGGKIPIGYDYVDKQLVINEFEKMQIVKIFKDYSGGKTIRKITQELNKAGFTHKYGEWIPQTVSDVLSHKTYMGLIPFNENQYDGIHEAIIDEALFNKVQAIKAQKYHEHMTLHRRAGKAVAYLAGFLYCKQCGAKFGKLTTKSRQYHYEYYACYSRIKKNASLVKDENCKNRFWRMHDLDDLIFNEIKKLSFEPILPSVEIPDDTAVINSKIKEIDSQIERLMDLYSLGNMPLDLLQNKIHDLNDQRNRLESEVEEIAKKQSGKISNEDALSLICSFEEILERGNFEEIHSVIGTLIDRIEIDGDDITIFWAFS